MPSLHQLRRAYEDRHVALFARARDAEHRLTKAEALGTIHAARLRQLRGYVRRAIREYQAPELTHFLAIWEPAFVMTIADAERSAAERAKRVRAAA